MKTGSNIQCQACGASSVIIQANKPLLECEYCGAAMTYSINPSIHAQNKPVKLGLLLVVIPVAVVILMVVFWWVFQNIRQHKTMDAYIADETSAVISTNQVTAQPAATSELNEKFNTRVSQNNTGPAQQVTIDFNQMLTIETQVKGVTKNGGQYWIIGVKNNGEQSLARPGVMLSLFNQTGERIEEQGGWSLRENLKAGEETVVLLYLDKQPDGVAEQQITTFASKPNQLGSKQSEVVVKSFTVNQNNNNYEIIGDVINNQSQLVKYVRLMVVAYDVDDKPVGIGNAFSTLKELAPDQESGFKVRVGTFLQGEPVNWKVWALGRQ